MADEAEISRLVRVASLVPYADIGRMTIEFARLDAYAQFLARTIIGDQEAGRQRLENSSTADVFALVERELGQNLPVVAPELSRSLQSLPGDAKRLLRRRHIVVHGLWLFEKDVPEAVRIRAMIQQGDPSLVADRIDPQGVAALAQDASELNVRTMLLALAIAQEH